jgi:hypothetical protein
MLFGKSQGNRPVSYKTQSKMEGLLCNELKEITYENVALIECG